MLTPSQLVHKTSLSPHAAVQADPPAPPSEGSPAAAAALAWEEESAGISEPLYGIIDELFRMQGRGFIRPLVLPSVHSTGVML